jgi:protein-disulfide isomerase
VSPSFRLVVASAVVALGLSHAVPSRAQDLRGEIEAVVREYLARHPEDVERIVKEYLLKHPEVVQQILADLIRRPSAGPAPAPAPAPDKVATIKSVAAALFNSPHQVTLGNPQGDVTLVEFFDYNCGFCKRSLADLLGLMQSDANLKIVLKEWPILGPGSLDAARVAIAVRMQDPGGAKYFEFHSKLLRAPSYIDKAGALAAATAIGLDPARLEKDMTSDEVNTTIEESMALARALGISGTPSYVIGENLLIGSVGMAALQDKVVAARK